ncbi:hypothetical protein GFY24_04040 [Nocardia sp. SYP-A9097]|uniref:hypothetical protein n=1 Tax=Nocardia sp. SYP-A9097 TaxID=2663237 RepID=UPI00129BEDC3|nr:hypothetical protein [Nocardia sp. SYP-A9097]MRH86649.1 hypothetical protein [Nocardia sp. SYP-A9097]
MEQQPAPPCGVTLPLAYGYLRLELLGDETALWEGRLASAARELGFELAAIFREYAPDATVPPAYLDLLDECRRARAHLVMTAAGHLSGMRVPRTCLLGLLAVRAGAQVCEVSP